MNGQAYIDGRLRPHPWRAIFAIAFVAALAACGPRSDPSREFGTVPQTQIDALNALNKPDESVIGVDDVLEVTFLKRYQGDHARYRFDVGDVIELQFFTHFDTPQSYTVQPDGRIYLPEIGSVMVRGFTAEEITNAITKAYKGTRMEGPVNLVARSTDVKVNELLNALKGQNGPIKSVRVLPDGTISLPLIDVIAVSGDTVGEVESMVNERYGLLFADMHVSLVVQEANSRRYGVLGEVGAPGLFPLTAHTTVLEALTKAGGIHPDAKHGTMGRFDVVLIRKKDKSGVLTEQLTIGSDVAMGQLAGLEIRPSDIVYVPTSHIAEVDRFVDQYLRRIQPVSTSLGYGVNTPTTTIP